ncbi:MAG: nucleoside-diphosphate kinase [bacterium]|nr:nucleoside-diphosphate kinase [bacterium]
MDFRQQTVVLLKPDTVKRGLVGEIISRFEKVGLKIIAMKMVWISPDLAKKHYPISREDWIESIGKRALETYKEYGRDPGEDLDSLDPKEIGKKMASWLVDFLTEGPLVAMLLEGGNAINTVRKMTGHTFGDRALPGTIRGDFSDERGYVGFVEKRSARNLVHASGNVEEAEFEKKLWFKENEIHQYKRVEDSL